MSTTDKQLIETTLATVERVSPELVEIRFKANVKLDPLGIMEVMEAKLSLADDHSVDVLAVLFPGTDIVLDMLYMDHKPNNGSGNRRRLAFAAQNRMNKKLAEVYFRYYPITYETQVFIDEDDARAWLLAS